MKQIITILCILCSYTIAGAQTSDSLSYIRERRLNQQVMADMGYDPVVLNKAAVKTLKLIRQDKVYELQDNAKEKALWALKLQYTTNPDNILLYTGEIDSLSLKNNYIRGYIDAINDMLGK